MFENFQNKALFLENKFREIILNPSLNFYESLKRLK